MALWSLRHFAPKRFAHSAAFISKRWQLQPEGVLRVTMRWAYRGAQKPDSAGDSTERTESVALWNTEQLYFVVWPLCLITRNSGDAEHILKIPTGGDFGDYCQRNIGVVVRQVFQGVYSSINHKIRNAKSFGTSALPRYRSHQIH